MPSIYLDRSNSTDDTPGWYTITYVRETYKTKYEKLTINLDYKIEYKMLYWTSFNVYIYEIANKSVSITYYPQSKHDTIQSIKVYYSSLHPEIPLVLEIKFYRYSSDRYYTYQTLKGQVWYDLLGSELQDHELMNWLDEQDKIVNQKLFLTPGTRRNQYIKQLPKDETYIEYVGASKEFKKVTFMANIQEEDYGKAYARWTLYSDNLLKLSHEMKIVTIDQKFLNFFTGKYYHNIRVYYRASDNLPLLVEFIEEFDTKKYLVRKDSEGKHWKREEDSNYFKDKPEEKLEEINKEVIGEITYKIESTSTYEHVEVTPKTGDPEKGFNKYIHKANFDSVKRSKINYNNSELKNSDQTTLQEIQNQKYKTITVWNGDNVRVPILIELPGSGCNDKCYYAHKRTNSMSYWEKLTNQTTPFEQGKLKAKLKELQYEYTDSIVILIDKTRRYGESDVDHACSGKEFRRVKEEINVTIQDGYECKDLKNFKRYKHKFSNSVENGNKYALRFYILQTDRNYKEIILEDNTGNKEYIYNTSDKNHLFVFFYGQDPRPLLLFYDSSAYKPNSPGEYNTKWVKVPDIRSCECSSTDNGSLKRKLDEITNDLNPVNTYQTSTYPVHTQWQDIKINVTYKELKCYNTYKHAHTKSGYRLGKITHNTSPITDEGGQPITAGGYDQVTVYYYIHDSYFTCPLMIELERKGISFTKEFYQPTSTNDTFKWKKSGKLNDSSLHVKDKADELSYQLLDTLFDLNKEFNGSNDNPPEESECKDSDMTMTIAIAASVPMVVITGGGGIAACVFRETIATFLKSLV